MKRVITYIVCCLVVVGVISCHKSDRENERGLAISLSILQQDVIKDVTLWAFDADGVLRHEYRFASPREVASNLIDLPSGRYTIVAASNLKESFAYTTAMGTTRLEELLITITDASSSPAHAHYGVVTVDINAAGISYADVSLSRSMAELSFTIVNVPTEVISAKLEVFNSSTGYYPAIGKLHPQTTTVDYGQVNAVNGKLEFPLKRMMPIVATVTRSDANLKAQLRMTLNYSDGNSLYFDIETPAIQNGGTYTPTIEYRILRSGIVLSITAINGWMELPLINGEVLNPNN